MFNKPKSNINIELQGINSSNVNIHMIKNKDDVTISVATNSETKMKNVDRKNDKVIIKCSTSTKKDTVDVSVDANNKGKTSKHEESSDKSKDDDNSDDDSEHHHGTEKDTMKIYDADDELNSLLNENRMQESLNEIRKQTTCLNLISNFPMITIAIMAYSLLISLNWLFILFFLIFISSILLRKYGRYSLPKMIFEYDDRIYTIMHRNRYFYDWKYLIYLLKFRIQQIKRQNIVFKRIILITLSLIGVQYFLTNYTPNWKAILGKGKSETSVMKAALFLIVVLVVVAIIVKIYDWIVNDYASLAKWHTLLNYANKVNMELESNDDYSNINVSEKSLLDKLSLEQIAATSLILGSEENREWSNLINSIDNSEKNNILYMKRKNINKNKKIKPGSNIIYLLSVGNTSECEINGFTIGKNSGTVNLYSTRSCCSTGKYWEPFKRVKPYELARILKNRRTRQITNAIKMSPE